MREQRKALSLVLVFALLLNLFLPMSLVSAASGTDGSKTDCTNVADDVYEEEQEPCEEEEQGLGLGLLGGIMPFANTPTEISDTHNLITLVRIVDKMDEESGEIPTDANNIDDIRLNILNEVAIYIEWEFPVSHNFKEGDTFTFQLPNEFETGIALPRPGDPGEIAGDDGVVGTYTVSANGKVVFTFNENIEDEAPQGSFYVWRKFDANKLGDSTKQKIEFEVKHGTNFTFDVHFQNTGNKAIEKNGTPKQGTSEESNNRNPDRIEWVVDFNLGEESVTGAQFTDTLPPGLTLDLSATPYPIEIYELNVKLNGDVDEETDVTGTFTPSVNGQVLTIPFGNIEKAYRVKYTTAVSAPSGSSPDYEPTYTNDVVITGTVDSGSFNQSKTANVKVDFNEPLKKSSTGYDSSKQEIEWTIEYNYNQQTIAAGDAWLEDTFDTSHQELVAGEFKVYKVQINSNGDAFGDTDLTEGLDYTLQGVGTGFDDGFRLEFPAGTSFAHKIVYKTRTIDRVHEESKSVTNTVEMYDRTSKTTSRNIGQEVFKKNKGSIDYNTKKITWTIHVNKDGHNMDNVVITDNFAGQGLTLGESTFNISGLTKGTDYTLVPYNNGQADPTYSHGFKVEFDTNNPITDYHTITYVTDFDPTYFDNNPAVTKQYRNNATIDWKHKPLTGFEATKTDKVDPNDHMVNNGEKSGSYDPTIDPNKGKPVKQITWTLDVNYNRHTLNNAVVSDFYSAGQNFVEGSLEVYHLTINSNGTVKQGVKLTSDMYDVKYNVTHDDTENGKKGFKLAFNDPINSAYQIVYKTSLEDEQVAGSYSNDATLEGKDSENNEHKFTYSDTVTPKFGGEYIKKIGAQTYNDPYATWTVNINRSQSHITNAVLTDTLSANQILQRDSFKLYKLSANQDGTYKGINNSGTNDGAITNINQLILVDPSNYTLTFTTDEETGKDSFTLSFKEPIENAYVLQYKAYLNASNTDPYENEASLNGQSSGSGVTGDQEIKRTASFSAGAGGKVFQTGTAKIKIKKVDFDDDTIPLQDAVFELYDESGTNLLETLTTSANGEAETTKKYKYARYLIKEVTPPDGYISNAEYQAGKVIVFDKDGTNNFVYEVDSDGKKKGSPYTFTNKKGNWAFELTKVDEDIQTQVLAGAKFKLQKEISPGVYEDVDPQPANLTTGADGKIRLSRDDVELDVNYQLIEIEAPTGYELDQTTTIGFKIKSDQTDLETAQMTNKVLTNGSVKLTKVDKHTNQQLQDAEFKLEYNQGGTGTWVQIGGIYTTDANGEVEVTGLDGGEYRFVEVTPPAGYELNTAELRFDLVAGDMNKEVTFSNEITPRSITLTKLGDNSEKLAGAIFELQDDSGQPAKDIDGQIIAHGTTAQDGTLTFNNLRPGKYQLVEITPPKGYKLDPTPVPVEIDQTTISISLDITNSLVDDGSVTIVKVDEEYNEILLEGAIFQIIDLATGDIAQDKDGNLLDKLTTDTDGKLTVTNLKTGKYRVVEVEAPEGYHLGGQDFEFEIDQEGQVETYTFKNKIIRGSVTLTKIRKAYPDNKLKGAEFTLYNEDGTIVKDQNGQELTGLTTNDNGQLVIPDLRPGTYYFLETKAPSGYKLSTEKISFTISIGNGGAPSAEVIAENERRPGGGGGNPPTPEEDPKKPVDPEDPKKPGEDPEKPLDPEEPEDPEQPKQDPKEPVEPETPVDPEQPEQPGRDGSTDEQGTNKATGDTSDQAIDDPNALGKDGRLLADSDAQNASQNKKLLPQTGEGIPWTPFVGLLFIMAALVLWFRRSKVQN